MQSWNSDRIHSWHKWNCTCFTLLLWEETLWLYVCDRIEPCFMSFLVSIAPLEWRICWSIGWCSIGISYREICIWSCGATQRWSKRGHGISHNDTVWSIQTKWWTSKWCGSWSRTQRTVSRSTSIFIYYCQDFLKKTYFSLLKYFFQKPAALVNGCFFCLSALFFAERNIFTSA